MEKKNREKEWCEECKKWVYLDRSRFGSYKKELERIDNFGSTAELVDWIKEQVSDAGIMTGLGKTALQCIYHEILASYL